MMDVSGNQPLEFKLPVLFGACDGTGQWRPSSAFVVLGEAAGAHADQLGFGYKDSYQDGLVWILTRMKVQYLRYPRFGEWIRVRTWPKGLRQKLFFARDYEVLSEDGRRLLAATSFWVVVNAKTRRIQPPRVMGLERLQFNQPPALDEDLNKLNLVEESPMVLEREVGYSDTDLLGHANNTRYIDWICDVFPPQQFRTHEVESLQINYERELLAGERISLHQSSLQDGRSAYFEGYKTETGLRSFEAALTWRPR